MVKKKGVSLNKIAFALLVFIAIIGVINLIALMGSVSPALLPIPTAMQTAIASVVYKNPIACYFASLGINTSLFKSPLEWIVRVLTTGWTDSKLIDLANMIEIGSLLGLI